MTFAIEFDFSKKKERGISLEKIPSQAEEGMYYWIDLDNESKANVRGFLEGMDIDSLTLDTLFDEDGPPRFNVFQSCLHFMVKEARVVEGEFVTIPVQVILGPHFMLTCHQGRVEFLKEMKRTYSEGFHAHSQSPSFLLFELADHLTHVYRIALVQISEMIEMIETQLLGETEDEIFREVYDLIRWLLEFARSLCPRGKPYTSWPRGVRLTLATPRNRFWKRKACCWNASAPM